MFQLDSLSLYIYLPHLLSAHLSYGLEECIGYDVGIVGFTLQCVHPANQQTFLIHILAWCARELSGIISVEKKGKSGEKKLRNVIRKISTGHGEIGRALDKQGHLTPMD